MGARPIGLLTTRRHPLLPYLLERLEGVAGVTPVLLFDEKDFSAKDAAIFTSRTDGAFPVRELGPWLRCYPAVDVPSHNGPECQAYVRETALELLVNAGTPRLVSAALLEAVRVGVLNVHPGVLPKYRGATCCEWAIYHDDPVGVTAHFMDTGLDSGPILFARQLPVRRGQTYTEVRVALYRLALDVCAEAVGLIVERGLKPAALAPQPPAAAFKPMPGDLLDEVKAKLARGEYRCAS